VINLAQDMDYVWLILIAAGVGAVGGLGAELLLQRADNTGTIELPGRLKDTRFFDIGFPASIFIGAIAAVAILYFFPPVQNTIVPGKNGAGPTTNQEYDLVKLVALSLIVGSAGPAFLSSAQSRVMSALNQQKAATAVDTGKAQVNQVVESAKAAVPAAVQEAFAARQSDASAEEIHGVAEAATAALGRQLQPQADEAKKQIDAIAQGTQPQTR
jgi:hypothetical protein